MSNYNSLKCRVNVWFHSDRTCPTTWSTRWPSSPCPRSGFGVRLGVTAHPRPPPRPLTWWVYFLSIYLTDWLRKGMSLLCQTYSYWWKCLFNTPPPPEQQQRYRSLHPLPLQEARIILADIYQLTQSRIEVSFTHSIPLLWAAKKTYYFCLVGDYIE